MMEQGFNPFDDERRTTKRLHSERAGGGSSCKVHRTSRAMYEAQGFGSMSSFDQALTVAQSRRKPAPQPIGGDDEIPF